MKRKFWKWIRGYSEKKLQDITPPYAAYQCTNCRTWSNVVDVKSAVFTDDGYDITCGQCEKTTSWELHGPIAIPKKQASEGAGE